MSDNQVTTLQGALGLIENAKERAELQSRTVAEGIGSNGTSMACILAAKEYLDRTAALMFERTTDQNESGRQYLAAGEEAERVQQLIAEYGVELEQLVEIAQALENAVDNFQMLVAGLR